MTGGKSKYFKPPEPDGNRDGHRRVKGLPGRAFVGGSPMSRVSERRMRVLGRVIGMAALPWFCAVAEFVTNGGWIWMVGMGGFFLANMFFLTTELMAHRELPWRGRSLLILWGPVGLAIFVSVVASVMEEVWGWVR